MIKIRNESVGDCRINQAQAGQEKINRLRGLAGNRTATARDPGPVSPEGQCSHPKIVAPFGVRVPAIQRQCELSDGHQPGNSSSGSVNIKEYVVRKVSVQYRRGATRLR